MKRVVITILACCVFGSAWAVSLYDQPTRNPQKIGEVNNANDVVPYYYGKSRQGWVKVGIKSTGRTAWVKSKDLGARQKQPDFKMDSIYIKIDKSKGKVPQLTVIKDGKPLPPKEAEKIYKQSLKQQTAMQKKFAKWQKQMMKFFTSENKQMQGMMKNFPLMAPAETPTKDTRSLQ